MSEFTLEGTDGHRLVFRAANADRPGKLIVDGNQPGEEVTIQGSLPADAIMAEVPNHNWDDARRRGKEVCGYDPHCMTCFCDDDGNVTCVPYC